MQIVPHLPYEVGLERHFGWFAQKDNYAGPSSFGLQSFPSLTDWLVSFAIISGCGHSITF